MDKNLSVLKQVLSELGKTHLFFSILGAKDQKSKREAVAYTFKMLASDLPKDDVSILRQLREQIAQVESEELRSQLDATLDALFQSEDKKSIPSQIGQAVTSRKQGFKFSLRPASDSTPKSFNWQSFGVNAVNRLLGKV